MNHNSVPTTCTATLITGWDLTNVNSQNDKSRVNARLGVIKDLISQGFYRDFAIIHAFTTVEQNVNDLMESIGFRMVFEGEKTEEKFSSSDGNGNTHQREYDSGNLFLWAISPKDYQEGLTKYKNELMAWKEKIDPPKKIDPKRQEFPNLRIIDLVKAELVVWNMVPDNEFTPCLKAKPEVFEKFIKINFGIDIKKWFSAKGVNDWTKITGRLLKEAQREWKAELV